MTVLAGIWNFSGSGGERRRCAAMLAAQRVYATEGPSLRSGERIAIGVSLYDLRLGRPLSPLAASEQGEVLVADVRLDNRRDLEHQLGLGGLETAICSDVELLLRALQRWGDGAIDRLRGDFAFALWDPKRPRLLLARDFLGQRPLHFHLGKGFFAFASMPKGLHALEQVGRAPNAESLAQFLALLPEDDDRSFFEGIRKVRPGHFTVVDQEGVQSHRYWEPRLTPLRLRRHEYVEAIRAALDSAVATRLSGCNGAVAAHLSGGLDSGAISSTAARIMRARGGKVVAFTSVPRIGFEGSGGAESFADESALARATAAFHPNIDHVLIRTGRTSPLEHLDRMVEFYDRPILSLVNLVWLEAIFAAAKERRLQILLSGARGNVSLSYSGMPLLPQLLRQGRIGRLLKEGQGLRLNGMRLGSIAAQTLGPFLPNPFWELLQAARGRSGSIERNTALRRGAVQSFGLLEKARAHGFDLGPRPPASGLDARLGVLKGMDYGNYNKGVLGGWGVDHRDPTADRDLVELCLSIPDEQFLADGVTRRLARSALADRMPAAVLGETRKGYQAADWYEGVQGARAAIEEEVAAIAACDHASSVIDCDRLTALVAAWPSGGWTSPPVADDYRLVLLRAIAAGAFARRAACA